MCSSFEFKLDFKVMLSYQKYNKNRINLFIIRIKSLEYILTSQRFCSVTVALQDQVLAKHNNYLGF